MKPEDKARQTIDALLTAAGWQVQDYANLNLGASLGVAIREYPLADGGFADYLLFVKRKAVGVVEGDIAIVCALGGGTTRSKLWPMYVLPASFLEPLGADKSIDWAWASIVRR